MPITSRSHKKGAQPTIRQCAEPGCTKPRRLKQAARYCEDHARSKNYVLAGTGPSATKTCSRPGCGKEFVDRLKVRTERSLAWHGLCPDCRTASPLTLRQLQHHRVPAAIATQWLNLGTSCPVGYAERP